VSGSNVSTPVDTSSYVTGDENKIIALIVACMHRVVYVACVGDDKLTMQRTFVDPQSHPNVIGWPEAVTQKALSKKRKSVLPF
jgi:hypothetical protein